MEYYESTCSACGHRWQWVGYKTGIGKTKEQLEAMGKAGKTCPRCSGTSNVDLDHTSPDARALDGLLGSVAKGIVEKPST